MYTPDRKHTFSIRVVLTPCRLSEQGIYSLFMRVVYRRKKREYSLNCRLHESNFRQESQCVVFSPEGILKKREPGAINRLIREEKEALRKTFLFLERNEPDFDLKRLMLKHHKERQGQHVETFILRYIDQLREAGKQSTAEAYTSGLNSLLRFCGSRKLTFRQVNYAFITDYMHYLRTRDISENTVHMYLSNFRAVYNKARKAGIKVSRDYPFSDLGVHKQPTLKRALTKEEIARIASVNLEGHPLLERARDLFMFSFYCRGMPFVDAVHLKQEYLTGETISYERNKTGQRLRIGIFPALRELLEKYHTGSTYVFPPSWRW